MSGCATKIALAVVIVGIVLVSTYIYGELTGTNQRPAQRFTTVESTQCFLRDAMGLYLDDGRQVRQATFVAGTQVAVLGDIRDYGEIEFKDERPGLAFIWRGTTYATEAANLGACE